MTFNCFHFRTATLRTVLTFAIVAMISGNPVLAEEDHSSTQRESQSNQGGSPTKKNRPTAPSLNFGLPTSFERKLTAEEVNTGEWELDVNGACVPGKGCPYKNKQGEVAYLPESEKSKLKNAKESSKDQAKEKGPQGIRELTTSQQLSEAFRDHADKKCVVVIFSAENCGPCKALKEKLSKGENPNPNVAIFTATRPTYQSVSGHELHDKYRSSLSGGVPKGFIFTPRADGLWEAKTIKTGFNPILDAIKACQ